MAAMLPRAAHRALLLVTTIARLDHEGAVAVWVKIPGICAATGKSLRWAEPTLQALTRAGVLIGRRGPKGGYRLNRKGNRPITVADVILAVTSDLGLEADRGPLSPWLLQQEEELRRLLRQTTIDSLVVWDERRERAA